MPKQDKPIAITTAKELRRLRPLVTSCHGATGGSDKAKAAKVKFLDLVEKLHARGWTYSEIAATAGMESSALSHLRARNGMRPAFPSQTPEAKREWTRQNRARQKRAATKRTSSRRAVAV